MEVPVLVLLLLLVGLAVAVGLVFGFVGATMRVLRRARAKGYTGPAVPAVLTVLPLVFLVGGTFAGVVLHGGAVEYDAWYGMAVGVGGVVVALGASALLVRLLPARPVRAGGRRRPRLPFRSLGVLLLVLAGAAPVALLVNGDSPVPGLQVWLPLGFFAYLCFSAARRADRIDAPPPVDPRPAVVWIRGFGNEGRTFGHRPRDARDVFAGPVLDGVFGYHKRQMTFEEYFAPTVAVELGRGQGLGNPRDYLPPHGVDRDYATDDSWRGHFADLVAGSRCVITSPGDWPELRYEFGVIRELGAHRRLFVLTPPARKARQIRFNNLIRGFPVETWADFATALGGDSGYHPGPDPGPGAVVAFDDDGRAVVLARGAVRPADYVAAVRDHLARFDPADRVEPAGPTDLTT